MERIPGVALNDVWSEIDLEVKSRITKSIAGFVGQLRDTQRYFAAIGNLYLRDDIETSNVAGRAVPTKDEKYVVGPIVTPYMFAGGRKLRVPRNLGPYSDDAEYIAALTATEREEMKLLLSADARLQDDFDKYLANDAEEIIEVLDELQAISKTLFPSRPRHFVLLHHDLSLANILVDPKSHEITGIVDWECVGTRPHWEDTHPLFLLGPDIDEEVEPLAPGDTDEWRVEHWENWEKTKLRLVFDQELGGAHQTRDGGDAIRWDFRQQLDWVDLSQRRVKIWMGEYNERCAQMEQETA